ncbi:bifunctional phosphopantothenoylcysteine decarboxylase/phosphopantothenate--cysteine ligase CoaBC [Pseudogracilibacillus sp. SO10305]|uniref:bifunctional phosphopantothenoylcysteine decarboxylase/phosphopantothenate--cysteine ligase CoaBC n=1 Tax=Pseudogracilibacillus sp. SO10305 TaxID=3098292 RepID=UPI00300E1409
MLKNKKVLLGVSGGIAVYKACDLTSKLTQLGADVKVVMTENATKFVSPLTFQALSRNEVFIDTFDEKDARKIAHIDLADWADVAIIAPTTANMISKLANGIADDMLTTILLATRADIYIAPAMNVHMYDHPVIMENMKKLAGLGFHFIEPGAGYLACGYVGKGRLEEPLTIIQAIEEHQKNFELLAGKHVLISAGPTREVLDPVRFFSNRSTGKMGFALAESAANFGAKVTLVAGPTTLDIHHPNITRVDVVSAEDMYDAMWRYYEEVDIVIKAAAVADYRPIETFDQKLKKQGSNLVIEMERTKDILQSLGEKKTSQYLVGFAAETNDPIEYGIGKLQKKHLDAIVINNVSSAGAGFGHDTNIVTYVNKNLEETHIPLASKEVVSVQILQKIVEDMKDDRP